MPDGLTKRLRTAGAGTAIAALVVYWIYSWRIMLPLPEQDLEQWTGFVYSHSLERMQGSRKPRDMLTIASTDRGEHRTVWISQKFIPSDLNLAGKSVRLGIGRDGQIFTMSVGDEQIIRYDATSTAQTKAANGWFIVTGVWGLLFSIGIGISSQLKAATKHS